MFGGLVPDDRKLTDWLDQLRRSESASRRGALVGQNLLEDANICDSDRQAFVVFVAARPTPTTPDAAARQYETFLTERNSGGPACLRPENSTNRLSAIPFRRLARVVAGDAFMKHNFYATNKRKAPRYHRATASVQTGVRMKQLQKKGIRAEGLRGNIGGTVVFAASADIADRRQRGELSADDVRNRPGLDDRLRFARDGFMITYRYSADRVPAQESYRPTVLDAGWTEVSAAFLPSGPGPARPGWTQDLATGSPAEPEVLHRSFAASEIETCDVLGPLSDDPPDAYKAVRLAGAIGGMR